MSSWSEIKKRSEKRKLNPKPGDYWHEMFCPYHIVLAVNDYYVTVCAKTKPVDDNHWTWDETGVEMWTRDKFIEKCRYANVTDKPHKRVVKWFKEAGII